jgi:tripartite-type tricarboxylate transporter receptor subunit TctC
LSKAKPGTLSYSTAAVPLGVFIERWKKETGADLVRVPFRGGGEAVTALLTAPLRSASTALPMCARISKAAR